MMESTHLRALLLPELEAELGKTQHSLHALSDGHNEFKPHTKSSALSGLAGHVAELPGFIAAILTTPNMDLASSGAYTPFKMETKQQMLAHFDELADKAVTALKHTSDQVFEQAWKLSAGAHTIFSGSRYEGYRTMGLNHMIHHRAQLGVYLRLLDHKVPSTYGPSADEK